MKRYVLKQAEGFESLQINELDSRSIGPSEIRIKVHAVSLNYRDLLVATGAYGAKGFSEVVPCSDGTGEIIEIGESVSRFAVGDRVAGIFMQAWQDGNYEATYARSALGGAIDGMLAEEVILKESGVVGIPEHLTLEEAATLPCAAVTAWNALVSTGSLVAGQTVLLQGTGGVSIISLQLAKLMGARVIITSSSDEKLVEAKALGADEIINYRTTENWDATAYDLTDRLGVDHVVEVGGSGTLNRSLRAVRAGGTVSLIGVLTGVSAEINTAMILQKAIHLNGIYVGSKTMFEKLNHAIRVGRIRPVIDRVFEFDEAKEAYAYLASGRHFGKVVIRVS